MHVCRSRMQFLLAVAVLCGGAARGAHPDDTNAPPVTVGTAVAELPVVRVKAPRDPTSGATLLMSGQVRDAEDLRLGAAPRTLPDALANRPGIMVQKTAHSQGSPYMRGFTGFRNVMMIDGVRLNHSAFRDGPNQYWSSVDPLGLDRLEWVLGPHGVLYGSDAIGGAVNAITRGARNLRVGSSWDRRLYARYAGAEDALATRAETIGLLTDTVVLTLGYSWKDFGDVKGGRDVGTQKRTGYAERDWDAKVEWLSDPDTRYVLAHQQVAIKDAPRTHRTIYAIDWKGLSGGNELRHDFDQDRALTYAQAHQVNRSGAIREVHAGVSRHAQGEDRDRLRSGDRRDLQGVDVETFGVFLTLISPTPLGEFIYGFDYYHDRVDSYSRNVAPDGTIISSAIQGPVADNADYDLAGLFLRDTIQVSERMTLILGVRGEYAAADADRVEDPATGGIIAISDNWRHVVGSAQLIYALRRDHALKAFAGVSQGYRAPNLSDLTRFDIARSNEIEVPAPDLDPETFVTSELGLRFAHCRLSGSVSGYYTDISDLIIRTSTGRVIEDDVEVTKHNAGDGYVQGLEIDLRWDCGAGLLAFGGLTWMDGKTEDYPTADAMAVREPLTRLMPLTGRAGLNWTSPAKRYWAEASVIHAAKADKLSSADRADTSRIPPGGTPAYTVGNLRAGWACTPDLRVTAAIENVTDEDYRIHGSGINEPGRNLVLAADWGF